MTYIFNVNVFIEKLDERYFSARLEGLQEEGASKICLCVVVALANVLRGDGRSTGMRLSSCRS